MLTAIEVRDKLSLRNILSILSILGSINVIGISQKPVRAFQIDTTDDNGLTGNNQQQIYDTFYQNGVSATQIGLNGTPTYSYNGTHDVGNFSLFGELSQNTGLGNINDVLE